MYFKQTIIEIGHVAKSATFKTSLHQIKKKHTITFFCGSTF